MRYTDESGEFALETGYLVYLAVFAITSAAITWEDDIKQAQIGRWLNRNIGKPIEKGYNKYIKNPIKKLFEGKKNESQEIYLPNTGFSGDIPSGSNLHITAGMPTGGNISSGGTDINGIQTGHQGVVNNTQGGSDYKNYGAGEGNISPGQFRDIYSGFTENQIMRGESSFLGYKYPNRMADKSTRFVMLANGNEVDMIHFMVVGRAGHGLGFANEVLQTFRLSNSAFNPQDLYSNRLGVNFFRSYGSQINQNPGQISNYIYEYFNSPGVLNPASFQPKFPTGPKW